MSIVVQADACVGAGQCALIAPEVFDQDDDGIVVVINPAPHGTAREAAARVARLSPARASTVSEA